ncbi:SseB family protein [Microbacterium protaetiae]|uniref:SseB family protein n=1 Tax=Microbacterium protaetiae TaxID=2509458 RepID=A0A4V0YD78_9MICO|nr:SseB family protein [Microbacterium protaetiae]QAY59761.1 SseB family protein [Microbacterium protaetiae]
MASDMPLVERALRRATTGALTMQSVMWVFAASTVYVPSGADPGADRSGMRPVYYQKGADRMLAVFTSPAAAEAVNEIAPYLVTFSGEQLLSTMPATDGLVVNPGTPVGFDVEPEGLTQLRDELGTSAA